MPSLTETIVEDVALTRFEELGDARMNERRSQARNILKVHPQLAVSATFARKTAPVLDLREFYGLGSATLQNAS